MKKIAHISIFVYLLAYYGHNFIPVKYLECNCKCPDQPTIVQDFYFTVMAFFVIIVSYIIRKNYRSHLTVFFLFFAIGSFINELLFKGSISYFELYSGLSLLIINIILTSIPKWKA